VSDVQNSYQVEVKNVDRVYTAIVPGQTRRDNMSKNIRALFDEFYADPPPALKSSAARGLNIVFYRHKGGKIAEEGVAIECGVQIAAPCESHGKVVCSSTPAGEVATVTHWGDYGGLGKAYDALGAWSKQTGRKFAGPFWEVYGHWHDDLAKVRTDVYQLLA
jgi:effector-binding domain-containing protein